MKMYLSLTTAAALASLAAEPALAAPDQYLPSRKAAALLADGVPWSADSPNGRSFKLTLNKDGTGIIRGSLFTQSVNWTVKGDAICIDGGMMSKCLRFQEVPGGLQGWAGDKPDLKVSR